MVAKKKGGTIDLLVENYKKIKHLHVLLVPGCTEIGGPNGAGKSSGLDAVSNLFGGKKLTPSEPVREGEEGYDLHMKLNELGLALSRTGVLQEDGSLKEEFVVTLLEGVAAGQAQPRPKEMMDKLLGSHSMVLKPLIEMKNADRIALLQRCAGLDFTELDARRDEIYSRRTEVNRETDSLKSRYEAMPFYADAPTLMVSVADLMAELEEQSEHNASNYRARRDHGDKVNELEAIEHERDRLLAQAATAQEAADKAIKTTEQAQKTCKESSDEIDKQTTYDLDLLNAQIEGAEEVNDQIKANANRDDVASNLVTSKDEGVKLTGKLREIDDEKKKLLADAKIPGGLSWEDGVVIMKNKPLEQASQVEQMDADIAISIAQNPKVPIILVNQGSLYDRVHRGKLDKVAKKHGVYVFFERVIDTEEEAKAEGVAVFMRDGTGINLDGGSDE